MIIYIFSVLSSNQISLQGICTLTFFDNYFGGKVEPKESFINDTARSIYFVYWFVEASLDFCRYETSRVRLKNIVATIFKKVKRTISEIMKRGKKEADEWQDRFNC